MRVPLPVPVAVGEPLGVPLFDGVPLSLPVGAGVDEGLAPLEREAVGVALLLGLSDAVGLRVVEGVGVSVPVSVPDGVPLGVTLFDSEGEGGGVPELDSVGGGDGVILGEAPSESVAEAVGELEGVPELLSDGVVLAVGVPERARPSAAPRPGARVLELQVGACRDRRVT